MAHSTKRCVVALINNPTSEEAESGELWVYRFGMIAYMVDSWERPLMHFSLPVACITLSGSVTVC